MKIAQVIACVALPLMLFLVIVQASIARGADDIASLQLLLHAVPQATGGFIALFSAAALLLRALGGAESRQLARQSNRCQQARQPVLIPRQV